MNDLISIIVPIYGVEKYLNQCIQSIVNQSYRNLDIILVDDGSLDSCPKICDEWGKKDSRIVVIHKQNGGLSDARNAGLAIARGTYIGFVDGDDWISEDMYNLLYNKILNDGCDVTACGVIKTNDNGEPLEIMTEHFDGILDKYNAMKELILENKIKQPVWYKLYKTTIIKDILFPLGKCHEDVFWSYQVIGRANRIGIISIPCYYYRQRERSIMSFNYSLKRLDGLEAKYLRQIFLERYMPDLKSVGKCNLFFSCIYHMQMVLISLDELEKKKAISIIRRIQSTCHLNIRDLKTMPLKQRIWGILAKISFLGTCKMRNILKIGF